MHELYLPPNVVPNFTQANEQELTNVFGTTFSRRSVSYRFGLATVPDLPEVASGTHGKLRLWLLPTGVNPKHKAAGPSQLAAVCPKTKFLGYGVSLAQLDADIVHNGKRAVKRKREDLKYASGTKFYFFQLDSGTIIKAIVCSACVLIFAPKAMWYARLTFEPYKTAIPPGPVSV